MDSAHAFPAFPQLLAALASGRESGWHFGAVAAVWFRGRLLIDVAEGAAGPGEALSADGLAVWLSSSKPLTALLILQAWERGQLDLDDTVARHIPEFGVGGKEGITIRHLLTHTGGIRMPRLPWPQAPWEETVAAIAASRIEPRWRPGLDAGYHAASSWFVLGEILVRLHGRPFAEIAKAELFDPLGCPGTSVGLSASQVEGRQHMVLPMWDTAGGSVEPSPWASPERLLHPNPGANAVGPVRDLARFWEMVRRGGSIDGVVLCSPQAIEAMLARHRVGLLDRTFRRDLDWGLGVIPNRARADASAADLPYHYGPHASSRAVGHSGARSSVGFCDREHELAAALWWNGAPSDAKHAARVHEALAALYTDLGIARP